MIEVMNVFVVITVGTLKGLQKPLSKDSLSAFRMVGMW